MRTPKTAPQERERLKRKMDTSEVEEEEEPRPLSEVVLECRIRWFGDALKEAKSGDVAMQVLVGQMYFHGYSGTKDLQKANYWIKKASRVRSSAWNVCSKRPGYHASDSDSESDDNS